MTGVPELDVRWRRFSVSAKGKDAIDAIRRPLFILLVVNAALALLVVTAAVVKPEWSSMKEVVVYWVR